MARLNADPEFLAGEARDREELEKHWAARDKALIPVVEALQAAGCPVSSPYDMLRLADEKPRLYIEAIPILLEHLQRPYPSDARVQIAFALSTPAAEIAWNQIVAQYSSDSDDRVKEKLANAIIRCANKARLGEVIDLVRDPKNGPSRLILLTTLQRSRDPRALATIMDLANDPDLVKEIAFIMKGRKKRMH
jgi:hypothetical protein